MIIVAINSFLTKCETFLNKVFDNRTDTFISRSDVLFSFIFSPFVILLLFNFINIFKSLTITVIKDDDILWKYMFYFPLTSFLFLFFVYSFYMYKHRSIFMYSLGSPVLKLLGFLIFVFFVAMSYEKIHVCFATVLLVINAFSIVSLIGSNLIVSENIRNSKDNNQFKITFISLEGEQRGFTFLKNINVLYYSTHILLEKYKISYKDVFLFEHQFSKKLYDFNDDELNVLKMYAFN